MNRHAIVGLAPLCLALAACGGSKPQRDAKAIPDSTMVTPAPEPTVKADTTMPTAAKSAAPATRPAATTSGLTKKDSAGFDRAIKAKFKIDEKTGKIDTIKRP